MKGARGGFGGSALCVWLGCIWKERNNRCFWGRGRFVIVGENLYFLVFSEFFFLGAVFPQPHRCFLCRFYWFLKGISFMLVLFLLLSLWFTLYTYLWTWLQTIVCLAFFWYILLICLSKTYAKPLETTQNSNSTPKKSFLSNFSYLYTSPLVASLMGKNECFPKKLLSLDAILYFIKHVTLETIPQC